MRRARPLLATLVALACLPATAHATQSARLHVRFAPEHLGQGTTIDLNMAIIAPAGQVPSPLTEATISYPRTLGVDVSGLGLATCSRATLEFRGPQYCPADSRMGQGSALAELAIGPEIIPESAEIQIVRAPRQGQIALFFYVNAATPVSVPIIFPGLLVAGPGDEESIHINVPLVPTLPEAPDVAVTQLQATLGPNGLTYYEHVHDHFIPYHPDGILLPNRCPRGGFAFSTTFAFLDGSHTAAHTAVPCPARHPDVEVPELVHDQHATGALYQVSDPKAREGPTRSGRPQTTAGPGQRPPSTRTATASFRSWASPHGHNSQAHSPKRARPRPMAQSFDACAAMPRAVASATVRGPLNARIAKETTIPGHHEQRPDFAVDVKPLFRESDRATMRGAFDLWSEDDVLAHGPAIAARLREGTMPCDAPWPKEQVALFERWLGQAGNG